MSITIETVEMDAYEHINFGFISDRAALLEGIRYTLGILWGTVNHIILKVDLDSFKSTQKAVDAEQDRKIELGKIVSPVVVTPDTNQAEEAKRIALNVSNKLNTELDTLRTDLKSVQSDVNKIDIRIKEREKVDTRVEEKVDQIIPKIDQILPTIAGIPLIPALVTKNIEPKIPTLPQINTEVGKAICNSANGGCLGNTINNQTQNINNNTNNRYGDVVNTMNAAGQAVDLSLLQKIDKKLGAQINPGGIGRTVTQTLEGVKSANQTLGGPIINKYDKVVGLTSYIRGFVRLNYVTQALNILTWWQTLHNAMMLSNSVGQTLLQGVNNVLSIFGIKDEDGDALDLGKVIGGAYESVMKAVLGAEVYNNLSVAWKKANRIYQATANIVNSVNSMIDFVRNVSEFIAENTGRIGNALKKFQVISPDAFKWMPEQVNSKSL
ncbi:MAG: hypothetical protein QNJ47_28155 [Nostocaceae cyanobacterium]|nr:hypothetical protein [Nostocaceae cyanobacterium]